MPQPEKVTVELPEALTRQFGALRQKLFRTESALALCIGLSAAFSAFFLLFVSDRAWDTPMAVRAALFAFALVVIAAAGIWWLKRWVLHPRDLRNLAVIVQKKFPRLGDRLLGIVELADEKTRPYYFSPELYEAAIGQVSAESAKFDFTQAVPREKLRRQGFVTAGLLVLAILPALLAPKAGWNAFVRWIAPLSKTPRFTLVKLDGVPSEIVAAHGENFLIHGRVEYRSFWHPVNLKAFLPGQAPLATKANGSQFELAIPGQVKDGKARLRIGDATHEIAILARHRPGIASARAVIQLPEYLNYPEQQQDLQGGLLETLEGSVVKIEAKTTRALEHASFSIGDGSAESLAVTSNNIVTPGFPAKGITDVTLAWKDSLGLTNSVPWKLSVQTDIDAQPFPEIMDMFRDMAILESEVLPIKLRALDDYGVKSVGLAWSVDSGGMESSTNTPSKKEYSFNATNYNSKVLEQTINISPAVLRVAADSTIEVRPFATDYLPGRERVEGPAYRIHVLGNARHAEMIRQNLESLLTHLEEISRLQEKIAGDTKEMKEFPKLDTPEAAAKAEKLQEEQERNAAQLQELAAEGMKTLREALRNPAFNEETLTQWSKDLQKMQKLAQNEMKEAQNALKQASSNPESREEKLGEALAKEEEAVQKLQEMQKKVNQGLDDLQALTLAQRLRQLGEKESQLETRLQSAIADTVGLMPNELPARYQKANAQLANQQMETQVTSTKLQDEISRFFERTQKPNYGEVSHEMTEHKTPEELERIKGLIQENIGMQAMQNLSSWSEKFNGWAAKLEPKSKAEEGASSGNGQGDQQEQQEDSALKQLMGLLRMRERQLNIQDRTGLLHQHIDDKRTYQDAAVLLAASQSKLNQDLTKQAVENPFVTLETPYNDAVGAMRSVEELLDTPRTDEVTHKAEDKSLAMLTDLVNLLNEEAKKSPSSSSSSQSQQGEQMQFLMQMMMPGTKPGMQSGENARNMMGGTTDRTGGASGGEDAGRSGESRSVKKSAGLPENFPTEFRQALENYFKALEASDK